MTILNWSSPLRVAGTRPLDPIPNEIYCKIFDYVECTSQESSLSRKKLLSSLVLVCRFFCALALPRIFKSLTFSGSVRDMKNNTPGYASFCRAVIKGQEPAVSLARHVRECEITCWSVDLEELRWVYDGFLGIYSQAITRMPNIKKIVLRDTTIDKRLLKAICGLKNVESLSIHTCDFGTNVAGSFLHKISSLKVKSLKLLELPRDEEFASTLSYMVNAECLERLESDYLWVPSKLLAGMNPTALSHLELGRCDEAALNHLLNKSPRLEILRTPYVYGLPGVAAVALSETSCRNLHTLECPASMIDLVAGRPVHTVSIKPPPSLDDMIFSLLKKSTDKIRVLHIPDYIYFSGPIYTHLESLEVLHIELSWIKPVDLEQNFDKVVKQLVAFWPPASSITGFCIELAATNRISSSTMDLHQQMIILDSLVNKHFPNIQVASLNGLVRWRKDPFKHGWKPFILPKDYRITIDILEGHRRDNEMPRDHDGFYETLLSKFHN